MATQIAEPSEIQPGSITDDNARFYRILVYQMSQENAGIKVLGLAEWKSFLGYNSYKADNIATYVGINTMEYDYTQDHAVPLPADVVSIVNRIQAIADQTGTQPRPTTGVTPLATRISTLEGYVENGWEKEGEHVDGLLTRTETNETDIADIKTRMGNGGSASNTLTAQIAQNASDIGDIENILGEPSSGSTPATHLCADVETLQDYVKDGWDESIPGGTVHRDGLLHRVTTTESEIEELQSQIGTGGGSSTLTGRVEILESTMPTKTNLTVIAPAFSNITRYAIGDYVTYNGNIWKFKSEHMSGDWNPAEVDIVAISDELNLRQPKQLSAPITVDGTEQTLVEDTLSAINTLAATNKTSIGTLNNLTTIAKSNLVAAINEVKDSIPNIDSKVNYTDLASAFDTEAAYTAGDYVIYNNKIYKFTTDHGAGDWDITQVVLVKITEDIKAIRQSVTTNTSDITTLKSDVSGIKTDLYTSTTGIKDKVTALDTTVNNSSTGLVTKVSTLESNVSALTEDVNTLKTDVNDVTTGLKTRVSTLETNVDTITEDIDDPTTGLKPRVSTLETDVDNLNTTVNDSSTGLVTKVDALETIVDALDDDINDSTTGLKIKVATNTDNITTNAANIASLQTTVGTHGSGGTAGTGLCEDVDTLKTVVGNSSSGLVKDVNDLKTTVAAAYVFKGNLTADTKNPETGNTSSITVDGTVINISDLHNGWIFNVYPSGSDITLKINGVETTYVKGVNIAWVEDADKTQGGYFDELGSNIDVSKINSLEVRTTTLEDKVTILETKFKSKTDEEDIWTSQTGLGTGAYMVVAYRYNIDEEPPERKMDSLVCYATDGKVYAATVNDISRTSNLLTITNNYLVAADEYVKVYVTKIG